MSITRLLEVRKQIKKGKPLFLGQDSHKKKRIRKRWVKPRGLHSKIRLWKRGYRTMVTKGYRSPVLVRGMASGLFPVVVSSVKDLVKVNPVNHGVVISSTVGQKSKLTLLQKAKELRLVVLNAKLDDFTKKVELDLKQRKEKDKQREQTEKEKKKKEEIKKEVKKEDKKEDKKEEKHTEKTEPSSEENGEDSKEKKELDKILTKKQ